MLFLRMILVAFLFGSGSAWGLELSSEEIALCNNFNTAPAFRKILRERCLKAMQEKKVQDAAEAEQQRKHEENVEELRSKAAVDFKRREEERQRARDAEKAYLEEQRSKAAAEYERRRKEKQQAHEAEKARKEALHLADVERTREIERAGEREWQEVMAKREAKEKEGGSTWEEQRRGMLEKMASEVSIAVEKIESEYDPSNGSIDNVSCAAGVREARKALIRPLMTVLLMQLDQQQVALNRRDEHRYACACLQKYPFSALKDVRERPERAWMSCPFPRNDETGNRKKCQDILDWEQEQQDRINFPKRLEDVQDRVKVMKSVLGAYELFEVVDVTPDVFVGKLSICEGRVRMNPDFDVGIEISEARRNEVRAAVKAQNSFVLGGKQVVYQVVRNAETGQPFIRVTQGIE